MERAATIDECLLEDLDPVLLNNLRVDLSNNEQRICLAMVLMRSRSIEHRNEAIDIFKSLLANPNLERRIDVAYCLALALYSLGEYESARVYCEELLREQPDMMQVVHLHEAIVYKDAKKKQAKEFEKAGLITIGVGIAASIAIAALASRRKR